MTPPGPPRPHLQRPACRRGHPPGGLYRLLHRDNRRLVTIAVRQLVHLQPALHLGEHERHLFFQLGAELLRWTNRRALRRQLGELLRRLHEAAALDVVEGEVLRRHASAPPQPGQLRREPRRSSNRQSIVRVGS
eukprot:330828-Prorocentrum_minimum.AAC.1